MLQMARQAQTGTQAGNITTVGVRATSTEGLPSMDQPSEQQATRAQVTLQRIAASKVCIGAHVQIQSLDFTSKYLDVCQMQLQ